MRSHKTCSTRDRAPGRHEIICDDVVRAFFFFSCGALPVVLVLSCLVLCLFYFYFFWCNIEAGAPGRHERIFRDVVRAGSTAVAVVVVCFLAVRFLSCLFCFVLSFFILQHRRRATRTEFSFVSYVLNVEGLVRATAQGVQY